MTTKGIGTTKHRLATARAQISEFRDPATTHYVFASDHMGDSHSVVLPLDTVMQTSVLSYRNMLFGKRITSSDISMAIVRHDYVSGQVYNAYDDDFYGVFDSDDGVTADVNPFYVTINEGTNWYVYKCLENNHGGVSTVEPTFADFSETDTVFYPTDGYRWKYMYTIDQTAFTRFATPNYFPVPDVYNSNAVNGAIDVIYVENGGRGYDNWYNGTFSTGDIKLNGNTLVYAIGSNASSNNDFYNDCYIYISSGAGAGQYQLIKDYVVNSTSKYIVLDGEFPVTPQNNWTYEISPSLKIIGDGAQTIDAKARAIINASGNSVQRIEMLNIGAGYSYAAATVKAADIVGVTANAVVRPVQSPPGGHGYHPPSELLVTGVIVHNQFVTSEGNTIFTQNDYAQVGILKNPKFANVQISLSSQNGSFLVGETVYRITPVRLAGVANVSSVSNTVGISSGDPASIRPGSTILFTAGTSHQIANVVASNSTALVMDSIGFFSSNSATLALANVSSFGTVTQNPTLSISLTNQQGIITIGDQLIGVSSGAYGVANSITINGLVKGFDTFTQTYIYEGLQLNTEFTPDELVYQTSPATANARFVCSANVAGQHRTYVTNQIGNFQVGTNIIGADSGAIASVVNKYVPDLVFGSGDVIYLENINPISRANTQTETFKFVLNY